MANCSEILARNFSVSLNIVAHITVKLLYLAVFPSGQGPVARSMVSVNQRLIP